MIVPSRGRPQNIAVLLDAWRDTASGSSRLLIAVDDDDPELDHYQKLDIRAGDVELVVGPRMRMGPTLNTLAVARAGQHFAVGFMGDDHRPRTVGWDVRFVEALEELGTGIVYGDDLLQREALPTAVVMTSDIIRALGYMAPPGLIHMYLDNAWLALGKQTGRIRYLPDVVVEHMHPFAGKAPMDAGYAEVNASRVYAHDQSVFAEWLARGLPAAVEAVNRVAA